MGIIQRRLDRCEEALASAKETVEIYRELAKKNPDTFLSHLAGSLRKLSDEQTNLGLCEEAIASATEAAEIYLKLAEKNSDAFLPALIEILNSLSQGRAGWPWLQAGN